MTYVSGAPRAPLRALARFSYQRKWLVLAIWIVAVPTLLVVRALFGGEFDADFSLGDAESERGIEILEKRFPSQSGSTADLIFQTSIGRIDEGSARNTVEAILAKAQQLPGVIGVVAPFQANERIAADGSTAFATVRYAVEAREVSSAHAEALRSLAETSSTETVIVEAGGEVVVAHERQPPGSSELIGIAAAAVILVIAFGSVVAMGVPILTALLSLGAAFALMGLLARFIGLPEFSTQFAAMIGLGVGIDYALFVVTRFREGLHRAMAVDEAVALAVDTAGRAVLFAGIAVVISLLGLTLMGIPVIAGLGIGAAVVVTVTVVSAVTLLPATLSALGNRIDALAVPLLRSSELGHERTFWYRLSRQIQRRPVVFLLSGSALLLLLAIPALDLRLAFTDAGNNPEDSHSRRAYDLMADGFGPGFNGPLFAVVDLSDATGDAAQEVANVAAATDGVQTIAGPRVNNAGDAAIVTIYPTTAPQAAETQALVHELRRDALRQIEQQTGATIYLSGRTAAVIDVSERIEERTPLLFLMVVGLSVVLLLLVFRSIAIPIKAALLNGASIAAAVGVVVAVFQWGWLAGPLGIEQTGPIEPFLPMMMFAVLFGLSMDYEVFLISRIREEYVMGRPTSEAVAYGLSSTARVITSAAAIMVAVFGSFILSDQRIIKEFGLGMGAAIFIDASIVRLLLVPSAMQLFASANWWLPAWLDRLLPRVAIEGPNVESDAPPVGARVPAAEPSE